MKLFCNPKSRKCCEDSRPNAKGRIKDSNSDLPVSQQLKYLYTECRKGGKAATKPGSKKCKRCGGQEFLTITSVNNADDATANDVYQQGTIWK